MAKKKSKECDKACGKKCSKIACKNKKQIKATKKLKTLISQAHPIPETFVQKQYNRLSHRIGEKFSQCSRLVKFRDKLSQLYHRGIERCKKLLYPV